MSRSCARPGCADIAVATLSYAYAEGLVVLDDLALEAHPMVHDLCARHAGGLRVPLGWELRDDRAEGSSCADGTGRAGNGVGAHRDLIGA